MEKHARKTPIGKDDDDDDDEKYSIKHLQDSSVDLDAKRIGEKNACKECFLFQHLQYEQCECFLCVYFIIILSFVEHALDRNNTAQLPAPRKQTAPLHCLIYWQMLLDVNLLSLCDKDDLGTVVVELFPVG